MEDKRSGTPFLLLPLHAELVGRLKWFVKLRWLAALGVICTILAAKYVFGFGDLRARPLFALAGFIVVLNVVYAVNLAKSFPDAEIKEERDLRKAQFFALVQIWADLVLLTLLVHFSGGVENPFSFFYVFHVILSSILLVPRYAITTTVFAVTLYSGLLLLEKYGFIKHYSLIGLDVSPTYLLAVIFAFGATMFIAAFVTISIRMQLSQREHEVEKAKEAMENLEAQKSGFMRLVSHELRSPIAAIQSSLGVVMNLGADCLDDSLRASLERAMNRAEELFNLTKDLLEYSRLTSLGPSDKKDITDVDFTKIVTNVTTLYLNQAKDKEIDFKVEVPQLPITLFGDPRSLDQIVTNLIANAIQYTPKGGKVSVKLEMIGEKCRLIVSDTGIGIPEKDIEKIGTEFYRSPNAKQFAPSGTGIGMTIVKEALRQHKGTMEIKSRKGEGTTIQVDIPLAQKSNAVRRT